MKLITSINGRMVKRGGDRVSVFDNSLLYAEGLFETCLGIDGDILFLKQHISRLFKGSRVIDLQLPVTRERLSHWMNNAIRAHPDRIVKVRLTVTAGEAARWVGRQGKPQVIISVAPHKMPSVPFKLFLSPFRVDQDSEFRRIKTLSYIIHAAALKQAQKAKCDDALLLNEKAHIAEVTSANIFWAKNGRVHTPPLSSGVLDGITRKIVMRESAKLGCRISEKAVRLDQLLEADEIFISSSLKLIIGVGHIKTDDHTVKFPTGPITTMLRERFNLLVGLI